MYSAGVNECLGALLPINFLQLTNLLKFWLRTAKHTFISVIVINFARNYYFLYFFLQASQGYTKAMLKASCDALREWLAFINMRGMPHPGQVSFHLPLLRNYALFLSQVCLVCLLIIVLFLSWVDICWTMFFHDVQVEVYKQFGVILIISDC